jgi:transglutaminase-like putative cysteine protease
VIEGAVDLEYFLGESISYKSGITVTDDETESPKLSVDNSQVDSSKAGTYPVTYTATDDAGNTTSVTVQLTLKEKPKGYVDKETVYDLAQKVLDDITNDSMTDMEVAFAIYKWTKSNIAYTGSSDKSSWTKGAYQAFTKKSGDCYNYFAAAKALYDVAGIENVDVIKSDTSHSSHYWSLINLGDGWYHVDCTPRRNVGYFFMNTDAELEAYSKKNKNSHIFDTDAYPERATESVQDLVDYKNGKVKG